MPDIVPVTESVSSEPSPDEVLDGLLDIPIDFEGEPEPSPEPEPEPEAVAPPAVADPEPTPVNTDITEDDLTVDAQRPWTPERAASLHERQLARERELDGIFIRARKKDEKATRKIA